MNNFWVNFKIYDHLVIFILHLVSSSWKIKWMKSALRELIKQINIWFLPLGVFCHLHFNVDLFDEFSRCNIKMINFSGQENS